VNRPTLADMRDELSKGNITEAEIRENGFIWYGFQDQNTGRVVVNPRPSVVHTLIHELVHRRFPRWGEKRVTAEADRLFTSMTDAEVAAFYRKYAALARKQKTPIVMKD
jgi:hypothetical protein